MSLTLLVQRSRNGHPAGYLALTLVNAIHKVRNDPVGQWKDPAK